MIYTVMKVKEWPPKEYAEYNPSAENAEERFDISWKEKNIIQSHMYPMTLNTPPASKEAWTVCLADKIIATKELFRR